MTPQCNVAYRYYNKEPLLNQQQTVHLLNNNNANKKPAKKQKAKKNKKIKCVLIGDNEVGKSSLVVSYSTPNHQFPTAYIPTAYDTYNVEVQVDGKPTRLELCDTAGQDNKLGQIRELCYPDTDVFLLCFSVVNPSSFRSAKERWAEEVSLYDGAIILVGTHGDLRSDPECVKRLCCQGEKPVTRTEALRLADSLNAPYVETSAKTGSYVKDTFDAAIMIALKNQRRRRFWKKLLCL